LLYSRLPILMHPVGTFTVGTRSADIQGPYDLSVFNYVFLNQQSR